MQLIKSGDYQALFEMAAMVRDAVTSAQSLNFQQNITHSTVVLHLVTKLLLDLQLEWGRTAYSLRPKTTTLADFDKWIDGVIWEEESRGANFFKQNNKSLSLQPRQNQYNGPTMLYTNIEEVQKENACQICRPIRDTGLNNVSNFVQKRKPTEPKTVPSLVIAFTV